MWARKRIDIGWSDLALGLLAAILPIDRPRLARRIEAFWAPGGDGFACLSVRSGFDLLLSALELPPGCEVLFTAVTIDDMRRIVAVHGLRVVPVDLDPRRMAPSIDALERACSSRTRVIVVAHLFGGRIDMEPILAWAHARGLRVIEDCAQAFCGPADRGHPESDVAMFSFGSIKTCTALGGALLRVGDRALLARMRVLQSAWPGQSPVRFAAKIVKYAALKFLSGPRVFSCFVRACRHLGRDYDRLLNGWVRGFAAADLLDRLRRQPSAPLLALLFHRLRTFDAARLAQRAAKGELLAAHLQKRCQEPFRDSVPGTVFDPAVELLGGQAHAQTHRHTHWVFPILCDEPERLIAALVAAGFDANRGGSMVALPAPPDRLDLHPSAAARSISRLVYLPCYVDLPDRELARMAAVVNRLIFWRPPPSALPVHTRAPLPAEMHPNPRTQV
ncbi:MAG TPA: DegT/DnrJ/EryC1/StrS family aminotransferase [Pirellulales bacterium]|jgi:dTDP-4-amino-4,6-dideoxygalactose transaminase|nr:DegT/DnrJ/EryC1/StrS family aminotransferase [Pirellulales bacterium]